VLFKYSKPQTYIVEHLRFTYQGVNYHGNGVLTWEPEEGFYLVARIHPKDKPVQIVERSVEVYKTAYIRLWLGAGLRAVLPLRTVRIWEFMQMTLSQRFSRALFIHSTEPSSLHSWSGNALFESKDNIILPDPLAVETKIQEKVVEQEYYLGGLYFEGPQGTKVIARAQGESKGASLIRAFWNFPLTAKGKHWCWRYADGFRLALSMLSGQMVQMKYREVHRQSRIYQEIVKNPPPFNLGVVFRLFDYAKLNKEMILRLAEFFAREEELVDVARRIFLQVAEASRQHTIAGQALLLSTTLEALLRTIYKRPFQRNKKKSKFALNHFLKKLRQQYLESSPNGSQWRPIISKVQKAYQRLRHRYAHPDWLTSSGGSFSKEGIAQIINDMMILSRFYGLVILRLAQIEVKNPRLPAPFETWGPISVGEIR